MQARVQNIYCVQYKFIYMFVGAFMFQSKVAKTN